MRLVVIIITIVILNGLTACINCELKTEDKEIERILSRIQAPVFPDKIYNVMDFQEMMSGELNFKNSVSNAIDTCSLSGGGTLLVPAGSYFCEGPIHLKSNVNLHFEEGAVVTFSQRAKDYLPLQFVRWEGVECYNYSPYIYANGQENIAITGKGILNGNAEGGDFDCRSKQKPSQQLMREMGRDGVPLSERIFGEGHYIRPSFIQLVHCRNILISDITITNVPFWVVHPTYCKNAIIRKIKVDSYNLNNDGVDPDSSEDILIEDCWFNTGDDAIAIKSGRDQDAWRVGKPSRDIVIRNCYAKRTHHGIAFGSEMSAGAENIYIRNFELEKVDNYAIQFKSNLDRGGYLKNISLRGISIDSTATAVFFTNDYHSYSGGSSPSEFAYINISDVKCSYASQMGLDIVGLEQRPIHNIKLERIEIAKAEVDSRIKNAEKISFEEVIVNGIQKNGLKDFH
jgi:polygalacturonase